MQRHLLIGGAGFIGSHIADILSKKKNVREIVIIDNFSRGSLRNLRELRNNKKIKIVNKDVKNFNSISKYIEKTDVIYFLAALRIIEVSKKPFQSFDSMCKSYLKILLHINETNKKVKIIFSSSASIYGQAKKFPTDETYHPYNNDTLYGVYKLFGEGLNKCFQNKNMNYVNLRYFNVIGPKMDVFGKYTEVIIKWFREIRKKNTLTVFGDGKTKIDFIDVRDVARTNVYFGTSKKVYNDNFNVANNKSISLIYLAKKIKSMLNKKCNIIFVPERTVNKVKKRLGSNKKIKKIINYQNNISIDKSLLDTYKYWLKENNY